MKSFVALTMAAAVSLTSFALATAPPSVAAGEDWPQWRGPDRNGISTETGLAQQWPPSGPPVVWSISGVGGGYGSVAVRASRLFVQGLRGRDTMIHSLNLRRRQVSLVEEPRRRRRVTIVDRARAARRRSTAIACTSSTESGRARGACATDGTEVWQRNILSDFRGSNITWLLSESPLIDGDRVIVTPGGRDAGSSRSTR